MSATLGHRPQLPSGGPQGSLGPDMGAPGAGPHAPGAYPRPQLRRLRWTDLSGRWDFGHDDGAGAEAWLGSEASYPLSIRVPYPPESAASGVANTGFNPVMWYRRTVTRQDLEVAADGPFTSGRVLVHFGAVDYRAKVWLDGQLLGEHEGGHTPFTVDITAAVTSGGDGWSLVVRAEDDPLDAAQPRGKQDWLEEPHGIWYHRTSGIWQPVWLEVVPETHVTYVGWRFDVAAGTVQLALELSVRPPEPVPVTVLLHHDGELLGELRFTTDQPRASAVITLAQQANGQAHEQLLWSPEHPRLIDATITVEDVAGGRDVVASYLGLRSVGFRDGHFTLNDRPYYVRAVLHQGYWPETHLAAPDADALRLEVQVAKDLGFNTVRVHQKVEDPRYLYWADRLGLMVWGESASAYEFSPTALQRVAREWTDVVRRDASHPCVVTWVPLNESWGVQHISRDPAQLHWAQALYHLTRALDPTRPVVSNDGWEHADSDIWTVHDYAVTGPELAASYTGPAVVKELLEGTGPLGRRMRLLDTADRGQPVMVSEFGGISYAPSSAEVAWGYATATEAAPFERLLRSLFQALQSSPVLAGFCYTQLTDTLQEANGLLDVHRQPKLPVAVIRSVVLGEGVDTSSHRRPKRAAELAHPHAPGPHAVSD